MMDLKTQFPSPFLSTMELIALRERLHQPLAPHDLDHLADMFEVLNTASEAALREYPEVYAGDED